MQLSDFLLLKQLYNLFNFGIFWPTRNTNLIFFFLNDNKQSTFENTYVVNSLPLILWWQIFLQILLMFYNFW